MKVAPRPTFSDGADQRHGDAVASGKVTPDAVVVRGCKNGLGLILSQFSGGHGSPKRITVVFPVPRVVGAPQNPLRVFARPVVVASCKRVRMQSATISGASGHGAMALSIRRVLKGCGPIKIGRGVVLYVSVAVRAMLLVGGLWSVERLTDKAMHLSRQLHRAGRQSVSQISSALRRGHQDAANADPAMVRNIPSDTADIRHRIGRSFSNFPPRFHEVALASLAFNIKLYKGEAT